MTKQDLVAAVAHDARLSQPEAKEAVESVLATIRTALNNGEAFYFRGFGTFKMQTYKAKKARNISLGTVVEIPERTLPKFIPSKNF